MLSWAFIFLFISCIGVLFGYVLPIAVPGLFQLAAVGGGIIGFAILVGWLTQAALNQSRS